MAASVPWPTSPPPHGGLPPQSTLSSSANVPAYTGHGSSLASSPAKHSFTALSPERPIADIEGAYAWSPSPAQSPGLQGAAPEQMAAAYDACRDELHMMGRELREAQQAPATPDAEYWQGQAHLLHAQLHGLYNFAGADEMRMQSELKHWQDLAEGESIAAKWKVAASEQKAQYLAHKTAETAVIGHEWKSRRDAEWLKTRLQASEEQRAKLTGLSEHYKSLACKQLDQLQENNAQMALKNATISSDQAKIQFLQNGNGWLVQKLRTSEEQEAHLACVLPEALADNRELTLQLSRTEEILCEKEAQHEVMHEYHEARHIRMQEDASCLRGEVWDATNLSGMCQAEMNALNELTASLRAKYEGVEDRRLRLSMLEEANKQLRKRLHVTAKQREEQDGIIEQLNTANTKLKKRLRDVGDINTRDVHDLEVFKVQSRSLEAQNMELRAELVEVTTVLESVGKTPAVPPELAALASSLQKMSEENRELVQARGSAENGTHPQDGSRSPAKARRDSRSPGRNYNYSPSETGPAPGRGPGRNVRFQAAMQNVSRALSPGSGSERPQLPAARLPSRSLSPLESQSRGGSYPATR